MAKSKKSNGKQDLTLKIIVLLTAALNLARALIDLIQRLIE